MNRVDIEIMDETKDFEISEVLTSGSTYQLRIVGGAVTVGSGEFIVTLSPDDERQLPRQLRQCSPVVAARASLTASGDDAVGVLSTNTDILQALALKCPSSVVKTEGFRATIHSNTNIENVATGMVFIRLLQIASGEPTGAAMLYKGPQGDPIPVTAIIKDGEDEHGNWIYRMEFSDGSSKQFVVPKGDRGYDALMTYLKEAGGAEKYHHCFLERVDGEWVLTVDQEGLIPEHTFDEATIEANGYMQEAKKYALGKFTDDDPPVLVFTGAKQYCEQAESAKTAAETARTGAENAKTAAENAKTAAENARTAAENARTAAENAKTAAENAKTAAVSAKTAAETAAAEVPAKKSEALAAIAAAASGALGAVESAKTSAIEAIGTAEDSATTEIENAKNSAIDEITEMTDVVDLSSRQTIAGEKEIEGGFVGYGLPCGSSFVISYNSANEVTYNVSVRHSNEHSSNRYVIMLFVRKNDTGTRTLTIDGNTVWKPTTSTGNGTMYMACTEPKEFDIPTSTISFTLKFNNGTTAGNCTVYGFPILI